MSTDARYVFQIKYKTEIRTKVTRAAYQVKSSRGRLFKEKKKTPSLDLYLVRSAPTAYPIEIGTQSVL